MNAVVVVGLALGMRHGTDPDHLAAIDGLTRIRPRATNGVYFALGHGLVVILLAVGIGHFLAIRFAFVGPWSLILIGAVNLWRLVRGSPRVPGKPIPVIAQPFLLGMLLAAGFETASQLSALILAGQTNAWLIGAAFSSGMVLVQRTRWVSRGLDAAPCSAWSNKGQRGIASAGHHRSDFRLRPRRSRTTRCGVGPGCHSVGNITFHNSARNSNLGEIEWPDYEG